MLFRHASQAPTPETKLPFRIDAGCDRISDAGTAAARAPTAIWRIAWSLTLMLALAACERESPAVTAPTASPAATATASAPTAQPLLSTPVADAKPPAAAAVLTAIYGGAPGDGDRRTLADGREAGFWYGYRYRSAAHERYTAFAFAAKPNESGFPAPGDQVALARITYTLDSGAWRADAPQTDVGEFGGLGRAPEPDATREPLVHGISADRALLLVPTTFFATGVTVAAYDIFAFEAKDGRWRYLGNAQTGEDHGAGCADDASVPDAACVRNSGILRFEDAPQATMPAIVVERSGNTNGDDGAVRPMTAADAVTYRYDPSSGRYQPPDDGP